MWLFSLFLVSFWTEVINGTRFYVKPSSSSDSQDTDGLSWDNALTDMSQALNGLEADDELWIAEGHYYPDSSQASRTNCFHVSYRVQIYGGFEGTETNIDDRPFPLKDTILDGDIGTLDDNSDNCYHIFEFLSSDASNSTISGIIFENGNADSLGDGLDRSQLGSAIFSEDVANFLLNIENCTFRNNVAREGGALWFSDSINITLTNCIFENNIALKGEYLGGYGGSIFCESYCKMWIYNTQFINNSADFKGGAIYADYGAHLYLENCLFDSNNISYSGHGGAIFMEDRNSQSDGTYITVTNSVFKNNVATYYGGAVTWFNGITPTITSTTFESNKAAYGGAIVNFDDTFYQGFANNVFLNNIATANAEYNDIFNDSLPDNTEWKISDLDNSTNITYYLHQLWDNRAYTLEFNYNIQQSDYICYVNADSPACSSDGCDEADGSSWDTAAIQLQDCIDVISVHKPSDVYQAEIWVAQGKYTPSTFPNWALGTSPEYYSFMMNPNISLYGGFDGTETDRNDRNWRNNPTYLTCNFTDSDTLCSMILIAQTNNIIDGFIFEGATWYDDLDTSSSTSQRRRRMVERKDRRKLNEYSFDGVGEVLKANDAGLGGGVKSNGTNVKIANCIFTSIVAEKGGGVYCMGKDGYDSTTDYSPIITNAVFVGMSAARGGAIAGDVYCNFECNYCNFINNFSNEKGGSVYVDWNCSPTFNNSVFINNFAYESGGCMGADGSSSVSMHYAEFYNNSAQFEGGCLYLGSHVGPGNSLVLTNGKFKSNSVMHNAGYADIWLWEENTITIYENNNTNTNAAPTNPPTSVSNDDNSNDNDHNNGENGDSGDIGDSGDSDDSNDSGNSSNSSSNSIFNSLSTLEWIIIGASVGFVLFVICVVCVIKQMTKPSTNPNSKNFRLLEDSNNDVENQAIGMNNM